MELFYEAGTKEPSTVQDVANNFFRSTTIHGYGRIYRQRSWHRRLLWSCICIGLTVWALYHILVIITDYYNYPTKINREVVEKKVEEFPAVTVCNLNPLGSPSKLIQHPVWGTFKKMDQSISETVCDDIKEVKVPHPGTAAKIASLSRDSKKPRALQMRRDWLTSLEYHRDSKPRQQKPIQLLPELILSGHLPAPLSPPSRKKRDSSTGDDSKNKTCLDEDTGDTSCFECADGSTISLSLTCDGRSHCLNGEDEKNCSKCADWAFLCDTGECIHSDLECDFHADCPGAEDETTCFACNDGSLIRPYWTCNGAADCPDGEDEIICSDESTDCPYGYYRCSDDSCIMMQRLCDGEYDCPRHLDEFNCDSCQDGAFRCSSGECVSEHLRCDGHAHCYGGDDEENCTRIEVKCPEDFFRCDDGACFNPRFQCDHIHHCLKGEDERNCKELVTTGPMHQSRMERSRYYRNLVSLVVNTTDRGSTSKIPYIDNGSFPESASFSPLCHTGVFCDQYGCYDSNLRHYVEYSPPRLLCSMCDGSKPVCWARHWLNEWRDGQLSESSLKMMMLKQRPDFMDLATLYQPSRHDTDRYSISPEDFVFACSFDKNYCDYTSFYSWPSDHYGRCYTFNSPSVENATHVNPWPKMITQAGPKNSLHLTLNIDSGISMLSPEVGVRVIIHSPHLLPVPEEEGFNLGPGSSSISIKRTLFKRMGDPHGECNDDYSYDKKMPFVYSRKLCNELCFEREIRKRCECRSGVSPAYNALGEEPDYQCNVKHPGDKICMDMVSRDYLGGYLDCNCHEACKEMTYQTQVTSSKINPQYFTNLHHNRKAVKSLCTSDMEMVNLEIYLESMSFEVISESPTYTWDLLLSNVGGFMGLFIGMSLVTLLELLELGLDLLLVTVKKPFSNTDSDDEEKQNRKNQAVQNHAVLRPSLASPSWYRAKDEERKDAEETKKKDDLDSNGSVLLKKTLDVLLMEQHDINKQLTHLKISHQTIKNQLDAIFDEEKTRC